MSQSPKTSSSDEASQRPKLLTGQFFAGVDLGQKRDHSVIAVVKKVDGHVHLVHLKQFKLKTEYASVLGYIKLLGKALATLQRVLIDQTGVGEVFVEEAVKAHVGNTMGIMLSLPAKQQVMVYLKEQMEAGRVHIFFDKDFLNEANVERYELTKTGQTQFSHPEGTHDDRLWAFALAVYTARPEVPSYKPAIAFGKAIKPPWQVGSRWSTLLPRS